MRHHHPGIDSRIARQKRRQTRQSRIDKPFHPSFRNSPERRHGDRRVVKPQCERLSMKIPARQDLAGVSEDQRIVRGAIDLNLECFPYVSQRIPNCAVDLWHTAKCIGVLNFPWSVAIRSPNLATLGQLSQPPRALNLSPVWPYRVNL